MNKKDKKQNHNRRWLKIFLWFLGGFFALILGVFLLLTYLFPSETVKTILIKELSTALNRTVEIQSVDFNLLKGIEINGLTLFETDSLIAIRPNEPPEFVKIRQAILSYRLWPLLQRKLEIVGIQIDSPSANLYMDSPGKWNFEDLIAPSTDTVTVSVPDSSETNMPLSIQLEKFALKNLLINLKMTSDSTAIQLSLSDFNGEVNNLQIPKGDEKNILSGIKANLRLFTNPAILTLNFQAPFEKLNLDIQTNLNSEVEVDAAGLANVKINSEFQFADFQIGEASPSVMEFFPKMATLAELAKLRFQANANLDQGWIKLPELSLDVLGQTFLQGSGEIKNMLEIPDIQFRISQSNVNLQRLQTLLLRFNSPLIDSVFAGMSLAGTLSLAGTNIQGIIPDSNSTEGLQVTAKLALSNFGYEDISIRVNNFDLNLMANTTYTLSGLVNTRFSGQGSAPTITILPSDTMSIVGNDLSFDFNGSLNPDFFPENFHLDSKLANFWDAGVRLIIDFESQNELKQFDFKGNLGIQHLNFDNFEIPEIAGESNLVLKINAHTLDEINVKLGGTLSPLYIMFDTEPEKMSPQRMTANLTVKTDTLFENFEIQPFHFQLTDFLSLDAHASLKKYGESGFNLKIENSQIDNLKVFNQLPASLVADLGEIDISGTSHLNGEISGTIPADAEPEYNGEFIFSTQNLDVDYIDLLLQAWNVAVTSKIKLTPTDLKTTTTVQIDSFLMTDIRRTPFKNNTLFAEVNMPAFERVLIPACTVRVADLGAIANFRGTVDSLETEPLIRLNGQIDLKTETSKEMIDDLRYQGHFEITYQIYMYEDLFAINAELNCLGMDLYYEDLASVLNIRGRLPVNQKINIEKLNLIQEEIPLFASMDSPDIQYNYLRPYYQNLYNPISSLNIEKIKMMDYELSDLTFDILFGGGKLEIPQFRIDAYEGNVLGQASVDLGEGSFEFPDSLLESTRFSFKSTFSSINTARLNPVISAKAKKSKINANLSLNGEGINPEGNMNIEGSFHITEIGPKVADNLLRALDPAGADQGIQSVRNMLKFGYKAKLMSFDIKHGHFYPTIQLSKPFYIPINIAGGRVELNRMPIEIFLKQAMASPYYSE